MAGNDVNLFSVPSDPDRDDVRLGQTVSGGAVVGTLTVTEADDTLSSAATVPIVAVASITEADDTLASTSSVAVQAVATSTEADDTLASNATVIDPAAAAAADSAGAGTPRKSRKPRNGRRNAPRVAPTRAPWVEPLVYDPKAARAAQDRMGRAMGKLAETGFPSMAKPAPARTAQVVAMVPKVAAPTWNDEDILLLLAA